MHPNDTPLAPPPAGKRCPSCGETKPFDAFGRNRSAKDGHQSSCKPCQSAAVLRSRAKHPEKFAAYQREYRDANTETRNAQSREYRKAHPDYFRQWEDAHRAERQAQHRAYYAANLEEERAKRRVEAERNFALYGRRSHPRLLKWQRANPERQRATKRRHRERHLEQERERVRRWWAANVDYGRLHNHRRRVRAKGAPSLPFTAEQLAAKVAFWGDRCAYCGKAWTTLDHVIPLARGGWHCLSNLRPACRSCNSSKHMKTLLEWLSNRYRHSSSNTRDALCSPVPEPVKPDSETSP